MHSRTQEVLDHLDSHRAALKAAIDEVAPAKRELKPAPGRWSVAEVLEHLAIVEGSITQLLRKKLDEARTAGLGRDSATEAVIPTVPVERLLDRTAKIAASTRSLPTGTVDSAAAWRTLLEHRRALRDLVLSTDGLALGDVVVPHGVLGPINVYQWLVFVGAHEARHAAQIRELAST